MLKKETSLLENTEVSNIEKLFFGTREVSLSMCYKTLKCYCKLDTPLLAQTWRTELDINITEEMWISIWNAAKKKNYL